MARIKLKHPRPKIRSSKDDLIRTLGKFEIYATRIFETENGFVVTTKDDQDTDLFFDSRTQEELGSYGFTSVTPPELKAKKSILLFKVDDYVYEKRVEDIKSELEEKNPWAKDQVEEVFKFEKSNTLKITFKQTKSAIKAADTGLVMFNISTPSSQIKQETFIPLLTCYRCYSIEDHTTKDCNKPRDHKICSECAEVGHTFKDCPNNFKRCINCQGDHRTLAMKCKIRKDAINTKKNKQEQQRTRDGMTYSSVTQSSNTINTNLGVQPGLIACMMNCIINAQLYNLAQPGTYNIKLNDFLKDNKLPPIKMPDNPPSAQILKALCESDSVTSRGTILPQEPTVEEDCVPVENVMEDITKDLQKKKRRRTKLEDMPKHRGGKTRTNSTDVNMDTDETIDQPNITHTIKAQELGISLVTSESEGWPPNLNREQLIDGIQRNVYKMIYTNCNYDEDEIYKIIATGDIELKHCFKTCSNERYAALVPGLVRCRDPRVKIQ